MADIIHDIIWQGREYLGGTTLLFFSVWALWAVYWPIAEQLPIKYRKHRYLIPMAVALYTFSLYGGVKPPPVPPPPGPAGYAKIYARPEGTVTNGVRRLRPAGRNLELIK